MSTKDINLEQSTPPEHRQTKPVVTFLKTNEEWSIANEYFKCTFGLSKEIRDVDCELKILHDNVYNYFKRIYGTVNNLDDDNTVNFTKIRSSVEKPTQKTITVFKSRVIRRKEPRNMVYI